MQQFRKISLYITIVLWGVIIGGVMYTHIVYFPAYLGHLPESNQLIKGAYGLQDSDFWMRIHPLAIVFTIGTLILHWKFKEQRKYFLIATVIYALAIFFTAIYFVPELIAFSKTTTADPAAELYQRGQTWQHRSWIRGSFLFLGFVMLLIGLEKGKRQV